MILPGSTAYTASKFGALGLTKVLAAEVRSEGIKVTAVIPGAVDTPLWDKSGGDLDRTKNAVPGRCGRCHAERHCPAGRYSYRRASSYAAPRRTVARQYVSCPSLGLFRLSKPPAFRFCRQSQSTGYWPGWCRAIIFNRPCGRTGARKERVKCLVSTT